MPTKKQNIETPSVPIRTPKTGSKRASNRARETATDDTPKNRAKARPQRTPTPAPIVAPVTMPETATLWIYSTPNFPIDRSTNPHSYGNGGKALGEFHTEADAKEWLKRNCHYGHFAVVERNKGKIGKSWHIEIEAPEDNAGNDADLPDDDDLTGDDLSMLHPDDYDDLSALDPRLVKRDIKIARLETQLEAQRNTPKTNGLGGTVMDKVLEQILVERLKPADPIKEIEERTEVLRRMQAIFAPKATNPAPQPQRSEDEILLSAIARNPDVIEKFTGGIFKKLLGESGTEEIRFADVAMEAVKNGELSKSIGALVTVAQNIFAMFLPSGAQQQPMSPQQTPQPQPAQQSQPTAIDAQPAQQNISAISPDAAYQETMSQVLTMLANNSPVEEAVKTINGFLFLYPQYADAIDMQLGQAPEMLLSAISAIPGCEPLAMLTHAKEWIENFQKAFFPDEEIEPNETSTPN